MHSFKHKTLRAISAAFLLFYLGNTLHMEMPVQVQSTLRDFGALILCTSGLFGMFLLVLESLAVPEGVHTRRPPPSPKRLRIYDFFMLQTLNFLTFVARFACDSFLTKLL